MLEVLTIDKHEKFLRQISKKVDFTEKDLQQNMNDIIEWCLSTNRAYAMAAIQFGIAKRIVYIKHTKLDNSDTSNENSQILMINPEIILKQGKTESWEACVSGLDNLGLVERPYKIVVKYQDGEAKEHIQEFEGFSATVVSHELDHLDGIFHMDRAKKLIQLQRSERAEYKKAHPYKVISKTCEFECEPIKKEDKSENTSRL